MRSYVRVYVYGWVCASTLAPLVHMHPTTFTNPIGTGSGLPEDQTSKRGLTMPSGVCSMEQPAPPRSLACQLPPDENVDEAPSNSHCPCLDDHAREPMRLCQQ